MDNSQGGWLVFFESRGKRMRTIENRYRSLSSIQQEYKEGKKINLLVARIGTVMFCCAWAFHPDPRIRGLPGLFGLLMFFGFWTALFGLVIFFSFCPKRY